MPNLRFDGKPRSAPVGRVKAATRASARLDAASRCRPHFHQQITLHSQDSRWSYH